MASLTAYSTIYSKVSTFPTIIPDTTTVSSISSSTFSATSSSSITSTLITPTPTTSTSITSAPIISTPITPPSTVPPAGKLSNSAKSGIILGVASILLLVVIAFIYLLWRRQTHRKNAAYDSRISEGFDPSISQPEVAQASHELDGEEVLELDGSMLYSPAEIDGAEAVTASSQINVQTSTIASKSDQESQLLPAAIRENKGAQTRNFAGRRAPPGKERKPRAEVDELDRLEEEERRIGEMIADAERLEKLRKQRLAIQDRIKQQKQSPPLRSKRSSV